MKATIRQIRDRKLQELHPEDYPGYYVLFGVLAQLHALNDLDYDAEVEMEFFDQLVKDFPPPVIPEIHTLNPLDLDSEDEIKYAVFGAGQLVFYANSVPQAKGMVTEYERQEKADGLYTPDFYLIVELASGQVIN